jgi:hypothetical protein
MNMLKFMIGGLLIAGPTMVSSCTSRMAAPAPATIPERAISTWRDHFRYGVELLERGEDAKPQTAFARAAFESAARFSRDYPPAYIGLGYTHMRLGEFGAAQQVFLRAGLMDDNEFHWAMGALAALKNGDERAAFAFYQQMLVASQKSDDDVSRFIHRVYSKNDDPSGLPLKTLDYQTREISIEEDLVCKDDSDDDLCEHLNIVAEIFFVRRISYSSRSVGNDFFSNLAVQLGAERVVSLEKDLPGDWEKNIADELTLNIPTIQYAVRALPLEDNENIYVNATPSVLMTLGNASKVREGSDRTILYNSEGFSDEFTAETGLTLALEADLVTAEYCRMKMEFEFSKLSSFTPGASALVLDVATSEYELTGYFPYDRPVVLGTMSNGAEEEAASGEAGLRHIPRGWKCYWKLLKQPQES